MKKLSTLTIVALLLLLAKNANAQQHAMGAQYFQNPYLTNPAMAGIQEGFRLNLGYRRVTTNMPDAPQLATLTAVQRFKNVGWGVNFYKDQAALLKNTKLMATYAYHVKLDEMGKQLHLGLSLGILSELLNTQGMIGALDDQTAIKYNDRENVLDGDFGIAFTGEKLTIEGALGNLKQHFGREDRPSSFLSSSYAAVSYKIKLMDWDLTSKVAYRGIEGHTSYLDAGCELKTNNQQLSFTTMYHSNDSFTLGLAYQNKKQWELLCLYNTPNSAIKAYTSGSFELGIQININNIRKQ